MKDGLENIDENFKQAFDGFESNVDPSVWNNIQNSISSGSGGSSTPQVDSSTLAGATGKSLALKIVAGVAIMGTVVTATYFVSTLFEEEDVIAEHIVLEDSATEEVEASNLMIDEEQSNTVTESATFKTKENNSFVYLSKF